MDLQLRIRTFWSDVQSSLWFRPIVAILLALALIIGSIWLEDIFIPPPILGLGPDSARAMLSAIASSMLTVVGLTFSILMVALVLASQQFSPRILHNFVRDRASQNVLSIFIGVFVYSLGIMGRINAEGNQIHIPGFSVLVAIGLALLGIGALIYFIDHIAKAVRANYIIAEINRQTVALLRTMHAERAHPCPADISPPYPRVEDVHIVCSTRFGYIQAIDVNELVWIAQQHDVLIQLKQGVGDYVAEGGELLRLWPASALSAAQADHLPEVFDIGRERTMFQDVQFGLRQLVDIALKAISPAVNDPTTAVNCIDALSNILIQAAAYPDASPYHCDEMGTLRVVRKEVIFADLVDLAFNQIRQYARADTAVTLRLLEVLIDIACATTDPPRRAVLWRHVRMISRGVNRGILEPVDRQAINRLIQTIAEQLGEQPDEALLTIHAPAQAP